MMMISVYLPALHPQPSKILRVQLFSYTDMYIHYTDEYLHTGIPRHPGSPTSD